jgi:Protein of unknown function (DUF1579)
MKDVHKELHITPGHEKLLAFVGDWTGEETVVESRWQRGGQARALVTTRAILGGFYVEQSYVQVREGRTSFEGRGVFGYDTDDRLYKLYWFDSLGFQPPIPASGAWVGDMLSLVRPSLRGAARHTFTFDGPDRYTLRIDFSWEGGENWTEVLTGVFTRR